MVFPLLASISRQSTFTTFKRQLNTIVKNTDLLQGKGLINGKWCGAETATNLFVVRDPSNEKGIAEIPAMGKVETKQAINAAADAFKMFRETSASERAQLLSKWHTLMMENAEDLAIIMSTECGKPFKEALGEVHYAASFIDFYAGECMRQEGFMIPSSWQGSRLMAIQQPVGVVAIITPWNFPLAMLTRKLAPALAAGCTAVIKPAEDTPLSAIAMCHLAKEAGFQGGVLNLVTADRFNTPDVGTELATNKKVRKLSFTGSTAVGKLLMQQASSTVKKVSLELGGNAPFIVFEDADLDEAVRGAMQSKYRNAGQTCVCSNRFYIHASIYDEFKQKFVEAVSRIKVGPGLEEGVTQGPLINEGGIRKIETIVSDAVSKGAHIDIGGKRMGDLGFFYEPTVLSNISTDMIVAQAEIFGPIAPLYKFESEDEVVELANATDSGLAGYFYSRDLGRVWRVAEQLEYGMVGVNTGLISTAQAPFGGVKESGLGREGSILGLGDFQETKYICMAGLKHKRN